VFKNILKKEKKKKNVTNVRSYGSISLVFKLKIKLETKCNARPYGSIPFVFEKYK
jgi:hypothetical protein